MKRRLAIIVPVIVALIALGAVLATRVTPRAHATKRQGWTLNSFPPTLDASYCGFQIDLVFPVSREYSKAETQPNGTVVIHITGAIQVSVTNHDTGKTLDYNASGPGTVTIYPDGSTFTMGEGLGLQFFPPAAQQEFGLPGVAYIKGLFTDSTDPSGNVTSFTHDGSPIGDVCAALS